MISNEHTINRMQNEQTNNNGHQKFYGASVTIVPTSIHCFGDNRAYIHPLWWSKETSTDFEFTSYNAKENV